jgi:hypothetical protein
VVLVVGVEDDELVVGKALGYFLPPNAKVRALDDVTVEAAVVVRVNNGIVAPDCVSEVMSRWVRELLTCW